MKITSEELQNAQKIIIRWFLQANQNNPRKPITMLETNVFLDEHNFRLFSFLTFYGKGELPPLESEVKKVSEGK